MDAVAAAPMQDHDEVPFVEAYKQGSLIVDVDGNVFADLVSAWGATPFGATPASVTEAVEAAQRKYGMEITDYIQSDVAIELAEKLVAIAPPGITRVTASLSGTLAVEAGVKLAREATGRPMILVFHGQYHGEVTYLTASVSSDLAEVNSSNSAYVGGLVFAPYPNQYRAPFHRGPGPYDDTLYMDFIEEWLLVHQVEPQQIAGVLIEPVLGEGGIHIPSAAFWERLTAACQRWGWKLILDEVQTGMGRCGKYFAGEYWDLRPDILLLGKGIAAGGQPIAAVMATEEVMEHTDVHGGGTFAWTPAACAGAIGRDRPAHQWRDAGQRRPDRGDRATDPDAAGRRDPAGRRRADARRVHRHRVRHRPRVDQAGAGVPPRGPPGVGQPRRARGDPARQVGLPHAAGAQHADRPVRVVAARPSPTSSARSRPTRRPRPPASSTARSQRVAPAADERRWES